MYGKMKICEFMKTLQPVLMKYHDNVREDEGFGT